MAAGKGIQIVVGTDYNDRDLKRAQRDLDKLKREAATTATPMQKLGQTIKGALGPAFLMAGAAAGAFAVKLAVDGVKAAMEEERELAVLKQTLDNVGQSFKMESVNQFIDDLRFLTGVSDSELRPAFSSLIGVTKNAEDAQRLLAAAVDASVGSGRDLSSVSTAVAKAVGGSSGALKRLIPELDATTIAGGGADKVIKALEGRFGGSASAAAQTFAGRMKRLQDGFGELSEAFGKGFLDQMDGAGDSVDELAQALRDAQPMAEELGRQLGDIFNWLSQLGPVTTFLGKTLTQLKGPTTVIADMAVGFLQGESAVDAFRTAMGDSIDVAEDLGTTGVDTATEMAAEAKNLYQATMNNNDAFQRQYFRLDEVAGGAGRYTDAMSLLRAEVRRTTSRLGFLSTAFDTANAAMERRAAMQNYKDALADFIADPSANTRDAVVEAMIGAAGAFEDPTEQAQFTAEAIGKIEDAARQAGVNVPGWLTAIGTAAGNQLDPVSSLKQELENIPENVNVTVTTTYVTKNEKSKPPHERASGGVVNGPGTSTSDSIPTMLSNGEFVIRAASVRKFGAGLFQSLNSGINPLQGMSTPSAPKSSGLTINGGITVNSVGGERADTSLPRALRRMAYLAGM